MPINSREFHVFWWSCWVYKRRRGGHLLTSPPLSMPLLPPSRPPAHTRTLDSASTSFLGSACPGKRGNSGAHAAVRLRVSRSTDYLGLAGQACSWMCARMCTRTSSTATHTVVEGGCAFTTHIVVPSVRLGSLIWRCARSRQTHVPTSGKQVRTPAVPAQASLQKQANPSPHNHPDIRRPLREDLARKGARPLSPPASLTFCQPCGAGGFLFPGCTISCIPAAVGGRPILCQLLPTLRPKYQPESPRTSS